MTYDHEPSSRYPGRSSRPLTDGARGGRDFRDGGWVGFEATDLTATIDLGAPAAVTGISIRALQDANAWIFLPSEVVVLGSGDGQAWTELGRVGHEVPDRDQRKIIHEFTVQVSGAPQAWRWVRVEARQGRTVPRLASGPRPAGVGVRG